LRGIGDVVRKAGGALLVSASTALLGGKGPNAAQLTEDVVKSIMRAMFGG
jgi:hypothetical protein